jgi:hypothetical protein
VHEGHEAPELLRGFGLLAQLFELPLGDVCNSLGKRLEAPSQLLTPEEIHQVEKVESDVWLLGEEEAGEFFDDG